MKLIKAIMFVSITLIALCLLQTKIGFLPPLGKFLNPNSGFWQNAESKNMSSQMSFQSTGLRDSVTIKYDRQRIPHVFANNDHDLYFAQGYVTAKDRLWQLDIQTRLASGRLSEIVGPKALEMDKLHRRMGMVYGAENTLLETMKDPKIKGMLVAYCAGVNSYIHSLSPKDYPIEFKLLDYSPEDYQPIDCALVLKLMSETLAGGSDDFSMTNTLKLLGRKVTDDLFPDHFFKEDPIIPKGSKWHFKPVVIGKQSKDFTSYLSDTIRTKDKIDGIGSNNWAISGSRSANGYPILANDPHLNLTFPSIWYQIQLIAPGVNVYGVSIPGTPAVVIGYNRRIGWGVTNVDADILDWYQIRFKDLMKNQYWYNNKWMPVKKRLEIIRIRGQKTIIDTVLYTHAGPVVYPDNKKPDIAQASFAPSGAALRWVAHDPSNEFKTLYLLNRSKNFADYRQALTYWVAPAQNFIFASNDKDIAITAGGKFPLKYKDQGKFIIDGSDTADNWHGWIPSAQNPMIKSPAQGYLSSANQSLTDSTYPYYINWKFGSYQRAKRINDKLRGLHHATVDSLRELQNDNYSIFAQDVLLTLLGNVARSRLNSNELKAYNVVAVWDKKFTANSVAASIYNLWWDLLYNSIWADKFALPKDSKKILKWPSADRTLQLLIQQKESVWYDNHRTPKIENRSDLIERSFKQAVDSMTRKFGAPNRSWQWGSVKGSHIPHLLKIDGLGTTVFSADGAAGVVNALSETRGPSWRMIVQFGPKIKGYGIFPGGQSGNPGSYYYDNMLPTWRNGKLNPLLFLESPDDDKQLVSSTLILKSK